MDTLLVQRDPDLPGLVTVTLNRPEKLNAISGAVHSDLQALCRYLQDDAESRVVIFTGAGRAFSAGADLGQGTGDAAPDAPSGSATRDPLAERINASMGNRTAAAIEALDQVTIGAVNGLTIGGAVVFLACMDIRLAAESAWFSIPEVDLDIPLTWNALPRLMRELGPARTKELVMTCDRFTAVDALRWGFVNHVTPDAELLPAARALAAKLLAKDPMSLALTKSTTNALAEAMVPAHVTHSDRDYLVLARQLARQRKDG
ncbi:MAG: enoyl-CoA hydratase/isomerase family protein [Dehalococcoidia bacterium]|nr:enoyl-CoA hydratase/isomerase family protein [Dehalococcoidia bacterium]